MIPQLIVLAIYIIAVTVHGVKHGQSSTEKYHFGYKLTAALIWVGILYWGGFFDVLIK